MVLTDTCSLVCTLFTVLPAMPYRRYEVPLGNLEGLPGITVTWTPVSNRAKSIYIRPLELVA